MSGNLRRQVDASCGGVPELGRLFRVKWPPYRLTFPVGAASPGGDPRSVELPAKTAPGRVGRPRCLKSGIL